MYLRRENPLLEGLMFAPPLPRGLLRPGFRDIPEFRAPGEHAPDGEGPDHLRYPDLPRERDGRRDDPLFPFPDGPEPRPARLSPGHAAAARLYRSYPSLGAELGIRVGPVPLLRKSFPRSWIPPVPSQRVPFRREILLGEGRIRLPGQGGFSSEEGGPAT